MEAAADDVDGACADADRVLTLAARAMGTEEDVDGCVLTRSESGRLVAATPAKIKISLSPRSVLPFAVNPEAVVAGAAKAKAALQPPQPVATHLLDASQRLPLKPQLSALEPVLAAGARPSAIAGAMAEAATDGSGLANKQTLRAAEKEAEAAAAASSRAWDEAAAAEDAAATNGEPPSSLDDFFS